MDALAERRRRATPIFATKPPGTWPNTPMRTRSASCLTSGRRRRAPGRPDRHRRRLLRELRRPRRSPWRRSAKALENPGKLDHQLLLTVAQLDGDASIVPALEKLIARDDLPTATIAKAVLVLKAKTGGAVASVQRGGGQTAHRSGREGRARDRVAGRSTGALRVPGSRRPDAVRPQADRRPAALQSSAAPAGRACAGPQVRRQERPAGRAALAGVLATEGQVRGRRRVPLDPGPHRGSTPQGRLGEAARSRGSVLVRTEAVRWWRTFKGQPAMTEIICRPRRRLDQGRRRHARGPGAVLRHLEMTPGLVKLLDLPEPETDKTRLDAVRPQPPWPP